MPKFSYILALAGTATFAALNINWSEFSTHNQIFQAPKSNLRHKRQAPETLESTNSHHPMNFILQEVREVPWDDKIHGKIEETDKNYTKYLYPQTEFVPLTKLDRKYISSGYKSINVYIQGENIPPGYDPELYFDGQVTLKAASSDKRPSKEFDPKTCSATAHDPNFNPFQARSFIETPEKLGGGGGGGGSPKPKAVPHKPIGCCNGKTYGEGKKCCCRRKAYVTSDEFCCAIDGCRAFQTYARTEDSMEACRAAGGIVVRDNIFGYEGKTASYWDAQSRQDFEEMIDRQGMDVPKATKQFIRDNRDRKIKRMYQWEDELEAGEELILNGVPIEFQKDGAESEFRNGMNRFISRANAPFHEDTTTIEIEESESTPTKRKWGKEKLARRQQYKARQDRLNAATQENTDRSSRQKSLQEKQSQETETLYSFDSDFEESDSDSTDLLGEAIDDWETDESKNSDAFEKWDFQG